MNIMRWTLVGAALAACGPTSPPRDADRAGQLGGGNDVPGSTNRTDADGTAPSTAPTPGADPTQSDRRLAVMIDPTASSPQPADHLIAAMHGVGKYPSLRGTVEFTPAPSGVQVSSKIDGLPAGPHGYHVHLYGDCSDPTAESMGGHLDFGALPGGRGSMGGGMGGMGTGSTPMARPGTAPTSPSAGPAPTSGAPTAGEPPTAPGPTTGGTTRGGAAGDGGETDVATSEIHGNLGDLTGGKSTASATQTIPMNDDQLAMLVGRAVVIHEKANDEAQPPDGGAGAPIACGVIGVANVGMAMTPPSGSGTAPTPGQRP